MRLFNTLGQTKQDFKPLNNQSVGLYTCGPTVYDYPHIGNWSTYLKWDLLYRVLRDNGYLVNWIVNITDVGHLVSDEDTGEDKLEKGAKREGKSAWEIAEFYTKDFIDGLAKLNISVDKNNLPRATEFISEQIDLIKSLEEKGFTYQTPDGIYFDSSRFENYGQLSKMNVSGLKAGARVDIKFKKNPTDFALWKFSPKDKKRDMQWDSPWGIGFPGWHLECSAIAMKRLGEIVDIHCGGVDHISVHHENEIAQSEAATGKKFANFWLHSNHILVNGQKIAKSAGNSILLKDIFEKNYTADDFRVFVFQSHYRTQSNFTWELLSSAKKRYSKLRALSDLRFQKLEDGLSNSQLKLNEYQEKIRSYLRDDLNSPQALAVLSELCDRTLGVGFANTQEIQNFINWIDTVFGFQLSEYQDISSEQKALLAERLSARENKDFAKSDEIRNRLSAQGIGINDSAKNQIWYRI